MPVSVGLFRGITAEQASKIRRKDRSVVMR